MSDRERLIVSNYYLDDRFKNEILYQTQSPQISCPRQDQRFVVGYKSKLSIEESKDQKFSQMDCVVLEASRSGMRLHIESTVDASLIHKNVTIMIENPNGAALTVRGSIQWVANQSNQIGLKLHSEDLNPSWRQLIDHVEFVATAKIQETDTLNFEKKAG